MKKLSLPIPPMQEITQALINLLKKACSAEKAAAFAYQGHTSSVKNKEEKLAIKQIELDEWKHRKEVLEIMHKYNVIGCSYKLFS